MDEAIWSCKVGVAERTALPEGNSDSPMRDAVEIAYRELTGRDPDFLFSGWGAELDDEERAAVRDHAQTEREIAVAAPRTDPSAPDGWQGTPPAEGTRRRLILDTIEGFSARLISGQGGSLTTNSQLELADAIETAFLRVVDQGATPESGSPASVAMDLLDGFDIPRTREGAILHIADRLTEFADRFATAHRELREVREENGGLEEQVAVKEETIKGLASTVDHQATALDQLRFVAPEAKVPAGTTEIHVVTTSVPDRPEALLVEIEDQDGRGLGNFERRQDGELTRIVIPYGRHDGWVASLVHRVAGAVVAGEPTGIACRRLLADVGVRTLCRKHSEEELAKGVRGAERRVDVEMPEGLRHSEREMWLRNDGDVRVLLDRISRLRSDEDLERLLEEREEARTREGRFAEERDCAFAMLRWLLPVTVVNRLD